MMNGYLVYDSAEIRTNVPPYWSYPNGGGWNDHPKMRARQLAQLGYVAMAIDVYGDGKVADNPDSAKKWSGPFYADPSKAKARIDAAIAKLETYAVVDTAKLGAIGYCFGGGILLNTWSGWGITLKGVVGFHASLLGTPARKDLLGSTKLLICHGNADKFVSPQDVATFKKQMDSIGASYTFIGYDSATHAFTNPAFD